jgi:hypothetical protein
VQGEDRSDPSASVALGLSMLSTADLSDPHSPAEANVIRITTEVKVVSELARTSSGHSKTTPESGATDAELQGDKSGPSSGQAE